MANELLIPVKYVVDGSDLDKAARQLGVVAKEEKELQAEMDDVSAAAKRQAAAFNQAGAAGEKAAKDTGKQYNVLGNSIGSLGGIIAGAFAVDRILALGKEVVNVTAEFQRLRAVLSVTLGSDSAADRAFKRIQDLAAKTPFSVLQLTDSFVKLANRGLEPTNEQLTNMGDLAAALGKDMGQLTEAMLDVNNTERWTELGIKVKTEGDKMSGTFKGVTIEVEKTEAGALKLVEAFGKMDGVAGTMAKTSDQLGGSMSNLNDTWTTLLATIGEKGSPIFQAAIKDLNGFLGVVNKLVSGGYTQSGKEFNKFFSDLTKNVDSLKTAEEAGKKLDVLQKGFSGAKKELQGLQAALATNEDLLSRPFQNSGKSTITLQIEQKKLKDQIELSQARYDAYAKAVTSVTDKQNALIKAEQKATETGKAKAKAEEDARKKKAVDDAAEAAKKFKPNERQSLLGLSTESVEEFGKLGDKMIKEDGKRNEIIKNSNIEAANERVRIAENEADRKKRIADDEAKYKERLQDEATEFAIFAASAYTEFRAQQLDAEMQQLNDFYAREISLTGDNAAAKAQLEQEYQRKKAELQTKQAQNEKNAALFQITVDAATAIIKTGAELGYPAAIPFQIFAAAQAAIQLALIQSKPIPKYAKGTRSVMGGVPGQDSVLAMLMPGERVITTEKNRALSPAFDALTNSKRSPAFLNNALLEIEKYGMFTPPKLSTISGGGVNSELLEEIRGLKSVMGGLPIEQNFFDERGYTRAVQRGSSRVIKLHKRYGF